MLTHLTPFFRVVTYDGRGQAEDFRPEGTYELQVLSEDLNRVVGSLEQCGRKGPAEQVCVLGLSNGGRVALDFARRYSSKVRALVVADCYHQVTQALEWKLRSWLKASEIGGALHRFDVATPWVWGESFIEKHAEVIESYRERAVFFDHQTTEKLIEGALSGGTIPLNEIEARVLLLVGREDILTPKSYHQAMARELPHSLLHEIPGGHASLLEHPEVVESVILPFFREEVL